VSTLEAMDTVEWCDEGFEDLEAKTRTKPLLLGLPCAKCGAYYDSELAACPICDCSDRVKPNESPLIPLNRAA
jgi:hypothetical protein